MVPGSYSVQVPARCDSYGWSTPHFYEAEPIQHEHEEDKKVLKELPAPKGAVTWPAIKVRAGNPYHNQRKKFA